jgi:3-oxoacyl-[acyl-carrier protein] reductase
VKAFVTGGTKGIGRAVAEALAARGDDVAIGYVHDDAAARAAAAAIGEAATGAAPPRPAVLVRGDVGDDPAGLVDAAAARLGGLDAFVACAVEPIRAGILELDAATFERTMRVNARPFVLGAVAAARHMAGGGRIVGLSSTGTHRTRNRQYAPLALAKGAIEAAVRFLAADLAERGITVNAVAPGPTETEAFSALAQPGLRERLIAATPMGRLGEPEDAARLIAFLCSPDAAWITGRLIFSDGGYSSA